MVRVLMVCNMPVVEGGGAEVFCEALVHELGKRDIDVVVAIGCQKNKQQLGIPRIRNKILRKVFFDYFNPFAVRRFKQILRDVNPDIVHFHNIYGLSSQLISSAKKGGYQTLVSVHDKWPFCYRPRTKGGCSDQCGMRFSLICGFFRSIRKKHLSKVPLVSSSVFLRKSLENYGFQNVVVIPNGIDIPEKLAERARRVLYVGRVEISKGVDLLPEIAALLERSDVPLHVVGLGPDADILSETTNITSHGFLNRSEINDFYQKGGVLLFLSRLEENQPLVILEALANGLPVLAVPNGGVQELIIDNETGVHVPLKPSKIVESILHILDNDTIFEEFQIKSREFIQAFSWDRVAHAYIEVYKSLTKSE